MARSILDLKHLVEEVKEKKAPRKGKMQEYAIIRDEGKVSSVEVPSVQGRNQMLSKMDELREGASEGVRFFAVSRISGKIYAGGGMTFLGLEKLLEERRG